MRIQNVIQIYITKQKINKPMTSLRCVAVRKKKFAREFTSKKKTVQLTGCNEG